MNRFMFRLYIWAFVLDECTEVQWWWYTIFWIMQADWCVGSAIEAYSWDSSGAATTWDSWHLESCGYNHWQHLQNACTFLEPSYLPGSEFSPSHVFLLYLAIGRLYNSHVLIQICVHWIMKVSDDTWSASAFDSNMLDQRDPKQLSNIDGLSCNFILLLCVWCGDGRFTLAVSSMSTGTCGRAK